MTKLKDELKIIKQQCFMQNYLTTKLIVILEIEGFIYRYPCFASNRHNSMHANAELIAIAMVCILL